MAHDEFPEGNDVAVGREPCPKCGSDNNLQRYADGHAHCFTPGCGYYEKPSDDGKEAARQRSTPSSSSQPSGDWYLKPEGPDAFEGLKSRRLSSDTLRRMGIFRARYAGKVVQVYPYYDQNGEMKWQKLRLPNKEFIVLKAPGAGPLSEARLFGMQAYGDRFDRRVVVVEGELDAATVSEVAKFGYPAVSLPAGADSVTKALRANWHWLNRFTEIILFLDGDAPGQTATEDGVKMFPLGRVKVAKMQEFKDPSEAHQARRDGDIDAAIYGATSFRMPGIVNAASQFEDIVEGYDPDARYMYPWKGLNDVTLGFGLGDVVYHVAGTGVGKSSVLRELIYNMRGQTDMRTKQPLKVGVLAFEDTKRDLLVGLLSIHAERRLLRERVPLEPMKGLYDDLFGSGWLEVYDPSAAKGDYEAVLEYIEYMVLALGCGMVVLDPLTFLIAASGDKDQVKLLDYLTREFAARAKNLGVPLHIAHHLRRIRDHEGAHEEGAQVSLSQIRGSGSIGNFAVYVIAYERDQQAGDDADLTTIRVLKNRPFGETGEAGTLRYDWRTGRLIEVHGAHRKTTSGAHDGPSPQGPLADTSEF